VFFFINTFPNRKLKSKVWMVVEMELELSSKVLCIYIYIYIYTKYTVEFFFSFILLIGNAYLEI